MNTAHWLSLFLSSLLVTAPLPAQTAGSFSGAPTLAEPPAGAGAGLAQVKVVENDGAETPAGSRSAKGITVEVTDAAGVGVAGAAIAVRLPESGPTGTFEDGTHSAIAYTDGTGRVQISGIQWSRSPGPVSMRVTATKGTAHAGVLLEETLTEPSAAVAPASRILPSTQAAKPPQISPVSADVLGSMTMADQSPTPPPFPQEAIPVARSGASGPVVQPGALAHPQLPGASTAQTQAPSVSVTTSGASGDKVHSNKTKWLIAAAVAAGAGGAMMAMRGKGSTPAAAAPTLSIGTPSISVGHP